MSFEYLVGFGLCIMSFDFFGVREGFGFKYVLCNLYFRCDLNV